jgi:hypothetical protein
MYLDTSHLIPVYCIHRMDTRDAKEVTINVRRSLVESREMWEDAAMLTGSDRTRRVDEKCENR